MLVELNECEQAIVKYMAKKRYAHCRKVGAGATIYGGEKAMVNEINSFGGEKAFCKLHNVYPDFTDNVFAVADCVMNDGNTVDVKTTHRENGRLLVKKLDKNKFPHYYALMIGRFPKYHFMGMMAKDELIVAERIDHSLESPAYAVTQRELLEAVYG
jgi:hypothetical protein